MKSRGTRRRGLVAVLGLATAAGTSGSFAQRAQLPPISAATAIVINQDTGAVLGAKNPDTLRANPSTTKIMTALLAIERSGPAVDAIVGPISAKAASTYGSTMNLNTGDMVSLRDLLYGLMLPSGNDAAVAIAEWISGDEAVFVDLMNQRARSLGLSNTAYRNSFGYDPFELPNECVGPYSSMFNCGHYTTARDLAALARAAMRQQPFFARIVQTVTWTPASWVDQSRARRVITLRNDNLLLSSLSYAGANGVKTGLGYNAGYCLVSSATHSEKTVMSVVMGCPTDQARHSESSQLLDWGFAQLGNSGGAAQLPTITVTASPGTVNAGNDASFVISTSQVDSTRPTTVRYTMLGNAALGSDYSLNGNGGEIDIPAGTSSARVSLHSFNAPVGRRGKRATLQLLPGTSYRLTIPKKATITITAPR